MIAGSADGVKEAPRRRRGCLDAGEHLAMLGKQSGRLRQSAMVGSRWLIKCL